MPKPRLTATESTYASAAVVLAVLATALPAAATTSYHLVDLGRASYATDVNHKGEVAGAKRSWAALYAHDRWSRKDDDLFSSSRADAIDEDGNMVGHSQAREGAITLVYYPRGGSAMPIPLPENGYGYSGYYLHPGMSPDGRNVGGPFWDSAHSVNHCFTWHPGDVVAVDIGLPEGYTSCDASDVNDAGQMVGTVFGPGNTATAFIYKDGVFNLTGSPRFSRIRLNAINSKGHAVGGTEHGKAVRWNGRNVLTLPFTDTLFMQDATAVNDHEEIVGDGKNGDKYTILRFADGVLEDLVPMIDNADGWDFDDLFSAGVTGINGKGVITGNAFKGGPLRAYMLVPND